MIDPVEFGKAMADIVKEATAPLIKRIEELESREPVTLDFKGDPGQSVTPEDVAPMVAAEVAKAVAAIPAPKDGETVEIAIEDITDAVLRAPGAIEAAVSKHLEANPPAPGKDGVGLAGAVIDRDGALVVTLTSGETKNLGPVVGRDGKDGADFTDFDIDYDGDRTITIKGRGGEITKRVPVPLDRGYWREGMACEKGDIVTEGGSAWIARRDTKAKPALEHKDDWRLFARKGRDGRDGRNGVDKTAPAKVKPDD